VVGRDLGREAWQTVSPGSTLIVCPRSGSSGGARVPRAYCRELRRGDSLELGDAEGAAGSTVNGERDESVPATNRRARCLAQESNRRQGHTDAVTLTEDLCAWVQDQPMWQQDLSRRLLAHAQLDDDGYATALVVVLAEHGALEPDAESPPPEGVELDDFPAAARDGDTPRVQAFGRLRGVGAVVEHGELRFATEGLTVVFGANAAGKSSYVAALKKVCRAVDCAGELRGNVFGAVPAQQTALLETVTGTHETLSRQVNLRDPQEPAMSAISVFDTRCAELYVDSENTVAFVPSALLLLPRLAATQDRMRADIERLKRATRNGIPSFADVAPGTEARRRADALSRHSDMNDIREFAVLSEEEERRRAELRAAIVAAEAQQATQDAEAADRDAKQAEALAQAIDGLAAVVTNDALGEIVKLALTSQTADEAVDAAAAQFAGLPVSGIGGDAWRQLWEAARATATSACPEHAWPPGQGKPCPLCLQPLSDGAAHLMRHFENHVQSELSTRAQAARGALVEALGAVDPAKIERCRGTFLVSLRENEATLADSIDAYLDCAGARIVAVRGNPTAPELSALPAGPQSALRDWAGRRRQHAATLKAAAQPEVAEQLRSELAELDARATLLAKLGDVGSTIAAQARLAGLESAFSDLNTNRVTRCQRELAQEAVTDALEAELKDELRALNCSHIAVELRARGLGGETYVALHLAGATGGVRVSEVLSEGEQRALSLAFFVAEVATAEHDGGIVLDDPVSSLDDERRGYIARRLVEEAQRRQVIVFTHDLPFLVDLGDQAKKLDVDVSYQWVWRDGDEPGRVDAEPPFSAMNFRRRVGALSERLEQWDNADPAPTQEDARRRAADFYRDMRSTWERGVEERLFRGVVTRFQREVKTQSLSQVVITDDLKRVVDDGMSRCSQFLHDSAAGTLTTVPSRTRLSADFVPLTQFERDTRAS
jgi:ABC-type transport system involved in cytochrome c biogenesis ATPase subunit